MQSQTDIYMHYFYIMQPKAFMSPQYSTQQTVVYWHNWSIMDLVQGLLAKLL